MQSLIIDNNTGKIAKTDNGKVRELNEEEKERAAYILIEILLYIFMKYLAEVGRDEAKKIKKQLEEKVDDDESEALPLLKIANSLANKMSYGKIREDTVRRYMMAAVSANDDDSDE